MPPVGGRHGSVQLILRALSDRERQVLEWRFGIGVPKPALGRLD
jgi:DNA-directed RNA polymerase sigma subunit (sigma70/sigma32)